MTFWDKICWFLGEHLREEPDNPYSYTCRRCGQYFITIGELDPPYHNEIIPNESLENTVDPKCQCVKRYKKRYWKDYP